MQDLRLVGVHDDGTHLLLSGAGGEMFQLPIDEALRTASRSTAKPRTERPAVPMSPRDIQARIRAGATAADVAELSGMPLAKVERYEGPVLAEREYVAQQARKVEVAAPSPGHDIYRSAFGDNPATLNDMVAHRLSAHGIDPSTVEWDSWRRQDGTWTVSASFEAKPGGTSGIGEEPPALWTFNPARKTLQNTNRWAQQLSELEPLDGPVPARRLTAVSDRPFDFETDADTAKASPGNQAGPAQDSGKDPDGLLDMLRLRRGQRLGVDEDSDDALALLLTHGVPAAHPRPSEVAAEPEAEQPEPQDDQRDAPAAQGDSFIRRRDTRPSMLSRLSLIPPHRDGHDDALRLHDGVSTDTREITIAATPQKPSGSAPASGSGAGSGSSGGGGLDELLGGNPRRPAKQDDASPATGQLPETEAPERPARPKRSSVPSWDEIVFGTRSD
ncbi:septal ring-binding cell division protein DamX [Pseudarthrobacter defluvii]|uniref:septation protein SepH n=1 Tax=Pseudarthrobacter defluvii TaxID=410837 RepID=UPI00278A01AF|nr:septation protein SepH [Pseudarthrobacter defluvii]MDQ0769642.1 septal ring-binding cell division protein DamX [Pseudarthrobacter defluvii]